jgi:hypothetical protein
MEVPDGTAVGSPGFQSRAGEAFLTTICSPAELPKGTIADRVAPIPGRFPPSILLYPSSEGSGDAS